ncbi:rhomboid family intramembrane serine protease [Anaeromicrobium sediminis]|uniref:Peptidase S54 rhomboid domain-containing protein n=1 Tax=Anaeromicrobium sediminis TaxID=1478221 RepID=A0A267MG87_9FIRM|nr:rhomboid family intramembrane serine protease [Anaeromicrobium sediminis]PAB57885.1 hypothetical protein CCE28_17975 [Anaeromicrobium sediminis]
MKNILKKIEYNSPVILTFSLLSTIIFFINKIIPSIIPAFFTYRGNLNFINMLLWPLAHGSMDHLIGNITLILLIGPMLEEKYTSKILLFLMVITTLTISLFQGLFFNGGILGASGIVFMMIVLTSFTNMKQGKIPLTFIFIALLFLTKEIYNGLFIDNNVSELAHILGALVGIIYISIQGKINRHT